MNSLVVLSALVGIAVAAPQFGRPSPQTYSPTPTYNTFSPTAAPTYRQSYSPTPAPYSQSSAPGAAPRSALIVKQAQEVYHDGSFNYNFETENGISSQADGQLKNVGSESEALVIRGSYSYLGDDGVPVVVNYIADENGFQPDSSILPTSPPVPEAIQRALDYLRSLPPSKDDQRRK